MMLQPKPTAFTPVTSPATTTDRGIRSLLKRYAELECDVVVIQRQIDDLVRTISYRIADGIYTGDTLGSVLLQGEALDTEFWPRTPMAAPVIRTRSEFEHRAMVARRHGLPQRAAIASPEMDGMRQDEAEKLDALDLELSVVKMSRANVEYEITEMVPESSDDAIAKLRFISALVIDDSEIDTDHFAYLVMECAEVLAHAARA